ncbi:MAG: hypothetical protein R6V36_06240 [Psychroflexus sp.]
MKQISLVLPKFDFKGLNWVEHDNVTSYNRAAEFEEQNQRYRKAGFTEHNSFYYQAFDMPADIKEFAASLFPRCSISVMRQPSGQTLPSHEDTFYRFANTHNIDPYDCVRINIFLEDWRSGHYFEINDTPIVSWKAGEAVVIYRDEPHLSGNMGMTEKYTMQITGVESELKRG